MTSEIKSINVKAILFLFISISGLVFLFGCGEDPKKEDVPELITKVTLTFTPEPGSGGSVVEVSATDPDGAGSQNIEPDGVILLNKSLTYSLSLTLINELADPTDDEYDITAEVEAEGDEHMFFFAWTNNLFSAPSGNGNIDNRNDEVDYQDTDGTYPIGLATNWEVGANSGTGTFRILLKHQPGVKNASSGSTNGETDVDLTFDIEIQ